MAKTAPEIIAFHLGWDIREVSEGRYQRYSSPSVYVCGNDYFCAPTAKQRLPEDISEKPWLEVGEYYGRKVYRAVSA